MTTRQQKAGEAGHHQEHHYAPTSMMTRRGMLPVRRYVAHPPGTHTSPIRSDMWAVEMVTDHGSRWQGCERAYIAADLRMVLVGLNPRDELTSKWCKVPASLRQGGAP